MKTSNKITLFRILLVPPFIVFALYRYPEYKWIAFWIFIIASITDFLDGYIARRYNEITKFGIFIDPLADKILISAGLIVLVDLHRIPSWIAIAIITRDFSITGLRTIAMSSGKVISASRWGKLKTVSQIVAISAVIIELPYSDILVWVALAFTLLSGIDYLKKNINILKEGS